MFWFCHEDVQSALEILHSSSGNSSADILVLLAVADVKVSVAWLAINQQLCNYGWCSLGLHLPVTCMLKTKQTKEKQQQKCIKCFRNSLRYRKRQLWSSILCSTSQAQTITKFYNFFQEELEYCCFVGRPLNKEYLKLNCFMVS